MKYKINKEGMVVEEISTEIDELQGLLAETRAKFKKCIRKAWQYTEASKRYSKVSEGLTKQIEKLKKEKGH